GSDVCSSDLEGRRDWPPAAPSCRMMGRKRSPARAARCESEAAWEFCMALMAGKQGLIMGVANERSLAWGIAKALYAEGAKLAFTYQGEALGKRVRPLAESVESNFVIEDDVTSEECLAAVLAAHGRS